MKSFDEFIPRSMKIFGLQNLSGMYRPRLKKILGYQNLEQLDIENEIDLQNLGPMQIKSSLKKLDAQRRWLQNLEESGTELELQNLRPQDIKNSLHKL